MNKYFQILIDFLLADKRNFENINVYHFDWAFLLQKLEVFYFGALKWLNFKIRFFFEIKDLSVCNIIDNSLIRSNYLCLSNYLWNLQQP